MMHKKEKVSKITEAMLLYLLNLGFDNVKMEVEIGNTTIITFIMDEIPKEIRKKLLDEIGKEREAQEEEYAWELVGESSNDTELEVLGMLIDKIEINEVNKKTMLKLTRFN